MTSLVPEPTIAQERRRDVVGTTRGGAVRGGAVRGVGAETSQLASWRNDRRSRALWSLLFLLAAWGTLLAAGVGASIRCKKQACHLHSESLWRGAVDEEFALSEVTTVRPELRKIRTNDTRIRRSENYVVVLSDGREVPVYPRHVSPVVSLLDPLDLNKAAKGNKKPPNQTDVVFGLLPSLLSLGLWLGCWITGFLFRDEKIAVDDSGLHIDRSAVLDPGKHDIPLQHIVAVGTAPQESGQIGCVAQLHDGSYLLLTLDEKVGAQITSALQARGILARKMEPREIQAARAGCGSITRALAIGAVQFILYIAGVVGICIMLLH